MQKDFTEKEIWSDAHGTTGPERAAKRDRCDVDLPGIVGERISGLLMRLMRDWKEQCLSVRSLVGRLGRLSVAGGMYVSHNLPVKAAPESGTHYTWSAGSKGGSWAGEECWRKPGATGMGGLTMEATGMDIYIEGKYRKYRKSRMEHGKHKVDKDVVGHQIPLLHFVNNASRASVDLSTKSYT